MAQSSTVELSKEFLDMAATLDDSLELVKQLYINEAAIAARDSHKSVNRLSQLQTTIENVDRQGSIAIAQGLHNIARKYKAYQYRNRALDVYGQTLILRREVLNDYDKNLSHTLDNMGDLLIDENELDSAFLLISEAMLIREQLDPPQPILKASSYTKMAKLYNALLDHHTALYYVEKANQSYKSVLPNDHPTMITSMVNLVSVCLDLGEFARAEQYARLIEDALVDSTDEETIRTYILNKLNLGRILSKRGELGTAKRYLEQALDLHSSQFSEKDEYYSYALTALGSVFMKEGQFNKSSVILEEAKAVIREIDGDDDPKIFLVEELLAENESNSGNHKQAIARLNKVIKQKEVLYGSSDYEIYYSQLNKVKALMSQGDYNNAEVLIGQLLESSYDDELLVSDPLHVSTMIAMTQLYALQEKVGDQMEN